MPDTGNTKLNNIPKGKTLEISPSWFPKGTFIVFLTALHTVLKHKIYTA